MPGSGMVEAPMKNPKSSSPASRLEALGQRYWDLQLEADPFYATVVGEHRFNDRTPDLSRDGMSRLRAAYASLREELGQLDSTGLPSTGRVDCEVLDESLALRLGDLDHQTHVWKVDQLMGPQVALADVVRFHPVESEKDFHDLLARFQDVPRYLDQYLACLAQGIRDRRVAPRPCVLRVIDQLSHMLNSDEGWAHLLHPLSATSKVFEFTGREALSSEIRLAVKERVLPAFAKMKDYLEDEYLACSREDVGVWAMEDGDDTYRHLIRKYTTTKYTAREIHDAGHVMLREVNERISVIARRLGKTCSPREFVKALQSDPTSFATSREQLLRAYAAAFERATAALPRMFGRLPRTPCEIRPIEPFAEKDAPGAYYLPPPSDGSRPGIFYANTYDPCSRALNEVETLTYHEAVPGHHLQIALAVENATLSQYRRYEPFDAFCEGWALYAEKLSDEFDLFPTDHARVGLLTAQALRACRLVVDTGMHALRWTRDQAVQFMTDNVALSSHVIEVEIDRYMITPGQALSYAVGMRQIDELRSRASRELGASMDLRGFHDMVLEEGAIPLTVLAGRVEAWIDERKARGA